MTNIRDSGDFTNITRGMRGTEHGRGAPRKTGMPTGAEPSTPRTSNPPP